MSAERTPPAEHSFLARPMRALTQALLRYPVATIAAAVILAVLSVLLAGTRLGYKTSRLDLLDPKSDYNRLWIEYLDEFGDEDDAVVVVEGPSRDQVVPVLREISEALSRERRLFHAVLHEVDLSKVRAKGLHYLPAEELAGIEGFLNEGAQIVEGGWSRLKVPDMLTGLTGKTQMELQQGRSPADAGADLNRFSQSLLANLAQEQQYVSPWPGMPQSLATLSELSSEYLLTKEGKLGFVLLRLSQEEEDGFARGTEAIDALRSLLDGVAARHRDAGVSIGLTGLPIMENDEMRASQTSMLWASIISLVAVALLFVAGFGGARHALMANLVLLIGMAWSFGYVTLAVGHLNILSITFAVTLIGIGIDYGVYYVARYMKVRGEGVECKEALLRTTTAVGPAILAGAMTTAVSFFAAGFTSFPGVAELGIIAGGGILLCCAAQLFVLPAVLHLMDRGELGQRMPTPLPVDRWIAPLLRTPRLLLAVTGAATLAVSLGIGQLWYDHNLLHLQPVGLESVELERKLLAECDQSMWYAISIADSREELLARKAEFLNLPSVERTEEIVSLLPADHDVKRPIIERIQQKLANLPERPPVIPIGSLESLGMALAQAQGLTERELNDWDGVRRLEQIRTALRGLPAEQCYQFLAEFQQRMAGDLLSRLHALKSVSDPNPPQLSDLPSSLVHRFVGHSGRHLLKIYGRGNIWDMDALQQFVEQVRSVDRKATGNPLQAYEASLEMKSSYEHAAVMALLVIFVVLLFDFRSIRYSLLAALPLGWGMLQTFGLLGLLNIPLNPANMIALSLILGIGVDYGVHMVHELREQSGRYRLSSATAIAVTVDGLTTLAGFGSLMIASHQGLQSLGRVLTLGIACCMFTSLVMLPALLTWMTRNRPEADEENAEDIVEDETSETVNEVPPEEPAEPPLTVVIRRRDEAQLPLPGFHAEIDDRLSDEDRLELLRAQSARRT